jgi:hypothetical protein
VTPIPPGIYGVALNGDDSMKIATLNRWGGDSTGSYNWQSDAFNSGVDWYCANYVGLFTPPAPDPTYTNNSDQFVHYNIMQKADTLMTIPITGWVATVTTPNSVLNGLADCPDAVQGIYDSNLTVGCCQELKTSYSKLIDKGSATLDTSFMGSWVTHLVSTFGSAANGGVKYYQLDNEPDNWQSLRQDIYPTFYPPGTFCEPFYSTNSSIGTSLNQDFINRTMAYAKAIKSADPTANVLFMSTENPDDLVALPNIECGNPAGPYSITNSLTQAILTLAAQQSAGKTRLLDCVDLHYPLPGNGLGDTQALWNSASGSVMTHVQGWINGAYPGTGICVSEYNLNNDGTNGSTPDASTGAQLADALGMYGRLGYKVASYWTTLVYNTTHLPIYNAMAMYRNYDGAGGQFGNVSIGAASPSANVNVYAATNSATNPTKLWVMLVNVSTAAQNNLTITLKNYTPTGMAKVYKSTAGGVPTAGTSVAVNAGTITGISVAQNSVVLLAM